MKKEKNNSIAKRLVVICSLCLALIVALGAFSFAWIQNYGDVGKATITTGKMLYKITMYRVNGDNRESTVLFDTGDLTNPGTDALASEGTETITKDIGNSEFRVGKDEQVFFVVEKYDDSIDFDVSIAFDNDGLASKEAYQNVGSIKYWLYDDSEKLLGYKKTVDDKTVVDVDAYIDTEKKTIDESKVNPSLSTIWTTLQEVNLSGTDKIGAAVRFKLDSNATFDQYFEDEKILFRIKFCIAQKDKLPEESDKVQTHYVNEPLELYDVMQNYGFNDEIVIDGSIDYSDYGDLVFTRPCKLTLIRANLTIKGNLSFSYMYDGAFTIDTVSDGHIFVGKNSSGAAGNFRIDLPNGKIEIKGANNDATGKADIYVEGMLSANSSKDEGEGIFLQGTRICDNTASDNLEPLFLNGVAKISISNRTRVGKISALSKADSNGVACTKLIIENSGYIEKIDLSKMVDDGTYITSPVIDIDNRGTIGNVNRAEGVLPNTNDGDVIILPKWAKKFDEKDSSSNKDNTRIKANEGSSKILAITSDRDYSVSPETVNQLKFFFSLGDRGDNIAGYPDDIEYNHRKVFVEAIDGDKTKIIIHYETPTAIVKKENTSLEGLTTLKSYVDFYSTHDAYGIEGEGIIAPAAQLKEVKIICYGNKVLTANDYDFIKTMTSVTDLDLSDATSVGKRVPDNAFKGMSTLTSVKMSESDTIWGKYIFTGTGVDEITFPQALTKLDNPTNSSGKVNNQYVLDGIRYVHTSITIVDGFYINSFVTQYIFTPDEYTYDAYRNLNKNNNLYWKSKIFLDNDVTRYGEFFLRLYPDTETCEVVAYTGGVQLDDLGKVVLKDNKAIPVEWIKNNIYEFDFQKIKIDEVRYTITSYDAFALFEKLICEEDNDIVNIVLAKEVQYIGEYAFACFTNVSTNIGLKSVKIEGNPEIMGSAFSYNGSLVSFSAPELTSLRGGKNLYNNKVLETVYIPKLITVEGNEDLANCPKLKTVDISVVEKNTDNSGFYTSNNDYSFAKFYIHTEFAKDVDFYDDALAADYRYIFVDKYYADLYRYTSTYTGVADIGNNKISDIISADVNGNDLTEEDIEKGKLPAYYYVIEDNKACLVACMLSKIDEEGNDIVTIESFNHGGTSYVVSKIGSAAYHFTEIVARSIKVSDGVKEIGNYAFYVHYDETGNTKHFEKFCITFDLNNVVRMGKYAFYYMDMARIKGPYLEEVGENTLSQNKNLIVANLPNLIRSCEGGETDTPFTVFVGCDNLRIAYTSVSNRISFDDKLSRQHGYLRIINGENATDKFQTTNINTIIIGSVKPHSSFKNNYVNDYLNEDGELLNVYFSDYYDYQVNLKGMTENISLPGYVYYKEQNNELTLFAVSPDIEYGVDYTTPHKLSVDGMEYEVTKLGKYSYGAISMKGVKTFTVAQSVKVLDVGALSGSGYDISRSGNLITLSEVTHLNLSNVEEIKDKACYMAGIVSLSAPKLKKIGESAFYTAESLEVVELPSYEEAGKEAFIYCTTLTKITLGKNAKMLSQNMFNYNSSLKEIYILNDTSVIELKSSIINSPYSNNVMIYVPTGMYNQYVNVDKKTCVFPGIAWNKVQKFGATETIDGITYYYDVMSTNANTVYIDYVEGTLPTSLTLPSTLGGKTVVSVSASTMKALSGVKSVTLPANMQYLTFTTADIAESVEALVIDGDNDYFKTQNGVLYTKDGSTLLVYPRGKSASSFTVGIGVKEIAYRAFYGASIEKITISDSVTVRDQAFESATGINSIDLTSGKNVTFAGRDTFLGANTNLVINKNGATVNILTDYSIAEKLH